MVQVENRRRIVKWGLNLFFAIYGAIIAGSIMFQVVLGGCVIAEYYVSHWGVNLDVNIWFFTLVMSAGGIFFAVFTRFVGCGALLTRRILIKWFPKTQSEGVLEDTK